MSEEEKIIPSSDNIQPSTEESNSVEQSQTENPTLQTEEMEVHKHPHHVTHKKKWGEYLLEFFMLFLAVFLGFVTENIRENFTNRESEKKSIESLIKGLASDTAQLQNVIDANAKVIRHLDSLVQLRNTDLSIKNNKKDFLKHVTIGFSEDWYFRTNDAAFQQLKSSGALRLISKQNIVDSIFKYETQNSLLTGQYEDCYHLFKESFTDFKHALNLFFYRDTSVMRYSLGYGNSDIEFKNVDAIEINPEKIKILFGDAALMAAPDEAYVNLMQDLLTYGKRLIIFLKKEYHLENE
ncbi:MAG: hypothetical protein ABIT07_13170 [Ferruginibacter sp.]